MSLIPFGSPFGDMFSDPFFGGGGSLFSSPYWGSMAPSQRQTQRLPALVRNPSRGRGTPTPPPASDSPRSCLPVISLGFTCSRDARLPRPLKALAPLHAARLLDSTNPLTPSRLPFCLPLLSCWRPLIRPPVYPPLLTLSGPPRLPPARRTSTRTTTTTMSTWTCQVCTWSPYCRACIAGTEMPCLCA